ncbi:MAG: hypothetical protein J6O61_07990 [Butyrivibrio sp.]|uniref:hypothetical protein n=1 Tax=Butyrivibrio sp. TaxID=28121 RepID=UPI001B128589|nr:hypothetical protein [Butyrivibrio sp.]MBO6240755.1 hypothetical protein [Butyrivibrio sp.]
MKKELSRTNVVSAQESRGIENMNEIDSIVEEAKDTHLNVNNTATIKVNPKREMINTLGDFKKFRSTAAKSVLIINEDLVDDKSKDNTAIKLDDGFSILAVKAEGCYFGKVVKTDMVDSLLKMVWTGGKDSYNGKFITGKNTTLSWVVDCLDRGIPFIEEKPADINVHHKIFRMLEIPENLRAMKVFEHSLMHSEYGKYSRNQGFIISDKDDLEKLRIFINYISGPLDKKWFDWSEEKFDEEIEEYDEE